MSDKYIPKDNEPFFNIQDQKTYFYKSLASPASSNIPSWVVYWNMVAEGSSELVEVDVRYLRINNNGTIQDIPGYTFSDFLAVDLALMPTITAFEEGEEVYDTHGQRLIYEHGTPDGKHVVRTIIIVQTTSYSGDDFDEHETDGHLEFRDEVFDKPPVAAFDSRILERKKEAELIRASIDADKRELQRIRGEMRTVKSRLENELAQYPNHQALIALLDKKVPKYSIDKETLSFSSDTNRKVLTFDLNKGSMESDFVETWNYKEVHLHVFFTRDDAEEWTVSTFRAAKDLSTDKDLKKWHRLHKDLGLELPYVLREWESRMEKEKAEEKEKNRLAAIQDLKNKLEALEQEGLQHE